jgi:hypothetical protein
MGTPAEERTKERKRILDELNRLRRIAGTTEDSAFTKSVRAQIKRNEEGVNDAEQAEELQKDLKRALAADAASFNTGVKPLLNPFTPKIVDSLITETVDAVMATLGQIPGVSKKDLRTEVTLLVEGNLLMPETTNITEQIFDAADPIERAVLGELFDRNRQLRLFPDTPTKMLKMYALVSVLEQRAEVTGITAEVRKAMFNEPGADPALKVRAAEALGELSLDLPGLTATAYSDNIPGDPTGKSGDKPIGILQAYGRIINAYNPEDIRSGDTAIPTTFLPEVEDAAALARDRIQNAFALDKEGKLSNDQIEKSVRAVLNTEEYGYINTSNKLAFISVKGVKGHEEKDFVPTKTAVEGLVSAAQAKFRELIMSGISNEAIQVEMAAFLAEQLEPTRYRRRVVPPPSGVVPTPFEPDPVGLGDLPVEPFEREAALIDPVGPGASPFQQNIDRFKREAALKALDDESLDNKILRLSNWAKTSKDFSPEALLRLKKLDYDGVLTTADIDREFEESVLEKRDAQLKEWQDNPKLARAEADRQLDVASDGLVTIEDATAATAAALGRYVASGGVITPKIANDVKTQGERMAELTRLSDLSENDINNEAGTLVGSVTRYEVNFEDLLESDKDIIRQAIASGDTTSLTDDFIRRMGRRAKEAAFAETQEFREDISQIRKHAANLVATNNDEGIRLENLLPEDQQKLEDWVRDGEDAKITKSVLSQMGLRAQFAEDATGATTISAIERTLQDIGIGQVGSGSAYQEYLQNTLIPQIQPVLKRERDAIPTGERFDDETFIGLITGAPGFVEPPSAPFTEAQQGATEAQRRVTEAKGDLLASLGGEDEGEARSRLQQAETDVEQAQAGVEAFGAQGGILGAFEQADAGRFQPIGGVDALSERGFQERLAQQQGEFPPDIPPEARAAIPAAGITPFPQLNARNVISEAELLNVQPSDAIDVARFAQEASDEDTLFQQYILDRLESPKFQSDFVKYAGELRRAQAQAGFDKYEEPAYGPGRFPDKFVESTQEKERLSDAQWARLKAQSEQRTPFGELPFEIKKGLVERASRPKPVTALDYAATQRGRFREEFETTPGFIARTQTREQAEAKVQKAEEASEFQRSLTRRGRTVFAGAR